MNKYYEKLGIGKQSVSSNMKATIKKVKEWSTEERMTAKISLQEDIADAEAYHSVFDAFALLASMITAIMAYLTAMDIFQTEIIAGVSVCISIVLLVTVLVIWISGRNMVHKYVGLLTLLEEIEKEEKNNAK